MLIFAPLTDKCFFESSEEEYGFICHHQIFAKEGVRHIRFCYHAFVLDKHCDLYDILTPNTHYIPGHVAVVPVSQAVQSVGRVRAVLGRRSRRLMTLLLTSRPGSTRSRTVHLNYHHTLSWVSEHCRLLNL